MHIKLLAWSNPYFALPIFRILYLVRFFLFTLLILKFVFVFPTPYWKFRTGPSGPSFLFTNWIYLLKFLHWCMLVIVFFFPPLLSLFLTLRFRVVRFLCIQFSLPPFLELACLRCIYDFCSCYLRLFLPMVMLCVHSLTFALAYGTSEALIVSLCAGIQLLLTWLPLHEIHCSLFLFGWNILPFPNISLLLMSKLSSIAVILLIILQIL